MMQELRNTPAPLRIRQLMSDGFAAFSLINGVLWKKWATVSGF
jgi:hypothetical protein